ncbi:MAG: hypothetical protein AAF667_01350 [Pseudomonadota bacterium]
MADFAGAGGFSHGAKAGFPFDDFPNIAPRLTGIEALPAWADTAPPNIGLREEE